MSVNSLPYLPSLSPTYLSTLLHTRDFFFFFIPEGSVYSRWRGVRDSYKKDSRKPRTRTKNGKIRPRRYMYAEQLSFLDRVIENRAAGDKNSQAKERQEEEAADDPALHSPTLSTRRGMNRTQEPMNRQDELRRNPPRIVSTRRHIEPHNGEMADISSTLAKVIGDDDKDDDEDDLSEIASSLQMLLNSEPMLNGTTVSSFAKKIQEDDLVIDEDLPHNGITSEPLPHTRPSENETTEETQEQEDDSSKEEAVKKRKSHKLKSKSSVSFIRPNKRKKMSTEERIIKFMEESVRREDEDKDFFMSMLPAVRGLSEGQKVEFRIQVLRVLQNIKGHYGGCMN